MNIKKTQMETDSAPAPAAADGEEAMEVDKPADGSKDGEEKPATPAKGQGDVDAE